LVGMIAANVWPILLLKIGMPLAAAAEALFLALYVWWVRGGGPPRSWKAARAANFRVRTLSGGDWAWGAIAAVAIATSVHAAIVVLFRLVPFPAEAFHQGYDLSFIPTTPLKLLACVVSAASAGICEETGFRGYMQVPIERRMGALPAILVSSFFFMLLHLTKSWALIGMVPIVFGAGLLYGALAWASRSLVFGMIGHTLMDIGLFAYWWAQVLGTFTQRPISETGIDQSFTIECAVLGIALLVAASTIAVLRRR
ncbi:MAG: CPBP family intramembrane metalloprotease, partial [Alphaproteobacteria bacterium]|nr:CPBP family intramembrane metalloprotease [Alphaproteobacteria bacterium]